MLMTVYQEMICCNNKVEESLHLNLIRTNYMEFIDLHKTYNYLL